jgi:7-cyano-7-deazaguanine synthase
MDEQTCLVLLSGGVDSATCIHFLVQQGLKVQAMNVNYGQAAAEREIEASKAIAKHFGVPLSLRTASDVTEGCRDVSRGRNALLLTTALLHAPVPGTVAIGIHARSRYPDCSDEFVGDVQRVYDWYTAGCLQIVAPFAAWSKYGIWRYAMAGKVPIHLTYSCDLGRDQPCGECASCRDLEALSALS